MSTTIGGITYDDDTNGTKKDDIIDQYGVWSWNGTKYALVSTNGTDDGTISKNLTGYNDMVSGGDGNDLVYGGKGNDYLRGDAGDDTLYGDGYVVRTGSIVVGSTTTLSLTDALDNQEYQGADAGNDILDGGAGNDKLFGGDGNDILIGGSGADELHGDGGIDTADYSGSNAGVTVNLVTGTGVGGDAQGDTLFSVENIISSNSADTLTGDGNANVLSGGNGNDLLDGGAGDDKLYGGNGKDTLFGGTGNDLLDGGTGNDQLFGGKGADKLDGGAGSDTLVGGKGGDLLTGGLGNDFYVYEKTSDSAYSGGWDNWDEITDFNRSQGDKIDLGQLTNAGTSDDLAWGGTTATTHGVWYAQNADGSYTVFINVGAHRGEDDLDADDARHGGDDDYKNYAGNDNGSQDDNERSDGHSSGCLSGSTVITPDMAIIVHTVGGLPPTSLDFLGVISTNSAPVLSDTVDPGAVAELANASAQNLAAITGTFAVMDSNIGNTLTASVVGSPTVLLNGIVFALPSGAAALAAAGAFTLSGPMLATGASQSVGYTYDPAAANLDFLSQGQSLTITYTIQVNDGTVNSGTQNVTFTITGTNDAAIISGTSTGAVVEAGGVANGTAGTPTATGTLTDTDVDNAANTFTASSGTTSHGSYTMSEAGV